MDFTRTSLAGKWIVPLALIGLGAALGLADQFRLKNGAIEEGEFIREDEKGITIRQKLPGGITSDRTIPKDQLAEMVRDPEDVAAFKKLPVLATSRANSYPLAEYNNVISNAYLPFLAQHPNSKHATEAQERLTVLAHDRDLVAAGGVKFLGKWHNPIQTRRRSYDFQAYNVLAELVQARAARNYPLGLQHWQKFESHYLGSIYAPSAIDEAIFAMEEYNRALSSQLQAARDNRRQYQDQLEKAYKVIDSTRMTMTITKDRMQRWATDPYTGQRIDVTPATTNYTFTAGDKASLDQAKKDKDRLPDLIKKTYDQENEAPQLQRQVSQKLSAAQRLRNANIPKSILYTEKAETFLDAWMLTEAEQTLKEALATWPQNHLADVLRGELQIAVKTAQTQPVRRGGFVPLEPAAIPTTTVTPPKEEKKPEPPPPETVKTPEAATARPPTAAPPAPATGGSNLLWIAIAGGAVLLAGGGAALFFLRGRKILPAATRARTPTPAPAIVHTSELETIPDQSNGTYLGDYEVLDELGSGGMGVVYRARQASLDRLVALKVLRSDLSANPAYIERFLREAKAAAQLNHPNIIQIYDAREAEGIHFFVMELVDGTNLGKLLKQNGAFNERDSLLMAQQVAEGLGFAHQHGIVHRDVKPENLMLTSHGSMKVCDLGLAKWKPEGEVNSLTATGTAMGTPYYISPEQIRGLHDIDSRSDVYSLGMTLYHLLAGQPAFAKGSAAEIMACHLSEAPPPLGQFNSALGSGTLELVERMIIKDRSERMQDMAAVSQHITAIWPTVAVQETS